MATIHPSRANLVPQDSRPASFYDEPPQRDRSSHPSRHASHSRSPPWRSGRPRSPIHASEREYRQRSRSGERRSRSRERGSPSYAAYKAREASGEQTSWGRVPPPRSQNGYGSGGWQRRGGGDYFEERRKRREATNVNIWPSSPKEPRRSPSPSSKKHKLSDKKGRKEKHRHRSRSRDRERSSKYRHRSKERYDSDRDRKRKGYRSSTPSSDTDTDSSEDRRRRRKRREKDRDRSREREREHEKDKRGKYRSKSHEKNKVHSALEEDDDQWVEKAATAPSTSNALPIADPHSTNDGRSDLEEDDLDELGPQLPKLSKEKVDERSYGGQLLRGEGSAMAAFLQGDTNARIPRRGEIGLTSDQIAAYENVGYVMSGSRHRRMNAVRMRKENQVISAEEKRSILKLQKEERARREELLKAEFRELVEEKLGAVKK